jgi:two-component system KDP operon response regulator KdpE
VAKKKILIVEDDPDVRRGMHLRLRANDYEVFFAADGMSSMVEARKHEPDLIILDIGLPAGDGFTVIERLKTIPSLEMIPIIIVSGRTGLPNQARAVKAGVKAFLQKPVDNAELLAVIRHSLGEPAEPEDLAVHDIGII